MFAKILGTGDIISALVILFYTVMPHKLIMYAALYLILKGLLFAFTGDVLSYIDLFIGGYILFLSFGVSSGFLTVLSIVFLLQKGIVSML